MDRSSPLYSAFQALEAKMRMEKQRHLFFSRFKGDIKSVPQDNNDPILSPSGSFIEVSKTKAQGLGDRMWFPLMLSLAGPGRGGDAVLIGHEEDPAYKFFAVAYNQIRHAVPLQNGRKEYLDEQILKASEYAQPMLSEWHSKKEQWEIVSALYEGINENVSMPVGGAVLGDGLAIAKRYNPNLYAWVGSTAATAALSLVAAAEGTFPTAQRVRDAAKNVNYSNHSSDLGTNQKFDSYTVRAIRNLAFRKNIAPLFTINGVKFFGVIISSEQADSLRNDTRYQDAMKVNIYRNLEDNPLVAGSIGIYDNCVFFEDCIVARGWAGSETDGSDLNILGSTPLYWNDNVKQNPRFEPMTGHMTETGGLSNHVATLFGASGLGMSDADPLHFETDKFDYNNWKGLAGAASYGYARLDGVSPSALTTLESSPTSLTGIYNRSTIQVITWQ